MFRQLPGRQQCLHSNVFKMLWLIMFLTVTSLWQHASLAFRDTSWIFAHYDRWMSVAEKSATQNRSSAKSSALHIQHHLDENSLSSCSSHFFSTSPAQGFEGLRIDELKCETQTSSTLHWFVNQVGCKMYKKKIPHTNMGWKMLLKACLYVLCVYTVYH